MIFDVLKKCNNCKKLLPATAEYFYRNLKNKDGFQYTCIKCRKDYDIRNKERIKDRRIIYILENKDTIREQKKHYDKINREKIGKRKARYYVDNAPDINKRHAKYNLSKKEQCLDHYGHKCVWPECEITQSEFLAFDHINGGGGKHRKEMGGNKIVSWIIKNDFPDSIQLLCHNHNRLKEKIRKKENTSNKQHDIVMRRHYVKLRSEIFTHYGLKCACCPENNLDVLEIDHIGGDGAEWRLSTGVHSGQATYQWLKKKGFPSGFRTLCANCNQSSGSHDICWHERQ